MSAIEGATSAIVAASLEAVKRSVRQPHAGRRSDGLHATRCRVDQLAHQSTPLRGNTSGGSVELNIASRKARV